MNFLAHIYLSGNNELLMIGNFIGDFIKGKMVNNFSSEIQLGIKLHRSIDTFTDAHPVVLESKKRLREKYSHYAPVITDIYYDHYLAANWQDYHDTPLIEYTNSFYKTIDKHSSILPDRVINMLFYMKRDNWLYNYQYFQGIKSVFNGMSRRTKFNSKMEYAVDDLQADYDAYEKEFRQFFPELQQHVDDFLSLSHD